MYGKATMAIEEQVKEFGQLTHIRLEPYAPNQVTGKVVVEDHRPGCKDEDGNCQFITWTVFAGYNAEQFMAYTSWGHYHLTIAEAMEQYNIPT